MTTMRRKTTEIARDLRRNGTHAETIFWNAVRDRQLNGFKFLRQHPVRCIVDGTVRTFIADFYCAEAKLIVEIDGPIHERQKDYDALRTHVIELKGIQVIRNTNDEIENRLRYVLDNLCKHLM